MTCVGNKGKKLLQVEPINPFYLFWSADTDRHKIQDEERLGNLTGLCLHRIQSEINSQLIYSIPTSGPDHPPLLKLYQEEANIWQNIGEFKILFYIISDLPDIVLMPKQLH